MGRGQGKESQALMARGSAHADRRASRRKPVLWPVGMYGSPISMREDQVTDYDFEVFFASLQGMSGNTMGRNEVEEVLEKLIGPDSDTFCERWAKGVNGAKVPMRENVITEDDEDILTEFFNDDITLDPARVREALETVLGTA